jgi:hypothetical protein
VKTLAKSLLRSVAPQTFASVMAQRSNRHARRVLQKDGIPELTQQFVQAHGLVVQGGPFQGMRYLDDSVGSVFIPKLIGCYEEELHPHFEQALQQTHDVIVDVGCAEGYYSAGLALRTPESTRVFAYDTDAVARKSCSQLVALNELQNRVQVGAFCDATELGRVLRGRALVVCDCEGYEVELLDPRLVPALLDANMVVELHDLARPGITQTLVARFEASHHISLVSSSARLPENHAALNVLETSARAKAVSEYRGGPQQWAVMWARSQLS